MNDRNFLQSIYQGKANRNRTDFFLDLIILAGHYNLQKLK
jgi:hypothetical protein